MEIDQAIKYFGTAYKLCKVLGIRNQNVTQWKRYGRIPFTQQIRIEQFTNGELKADDWRSTHE